VTCHACKGEIEALDEQNTHAVCPWCGVVTPPLREGPSGG